MRPPTRGGIAVTIGLIGYMWAGTALATFITGVPDSALQTPAGAPEGEAGAPAGTSPTAVPVSTPERRQQPEASRSRVHWTDRGGATPLNWHALATCESANIPTADTGNGYYGAYQFDLETWRSVGGTGLPSNASLAEQTRRAELLYAERGRQPWPVCGRWLS